MKLILVRIVLCLMIAGTFAVSGFAQGRGRGNGLGRRSEVFDRDFRGNRSRSRDWKCGKFVNCHDARDGRVDGRGPRQATGFWRNRNYARGSSVGYRRRYNMNDYWQRRHLRYGTRYNSRWYR
jgi:hypothetical protein